MREGRRIVRRCACLLGLIGLSIAWAPAGALAAPEIKFIKSQPSGQARVHHPFIAEAEAVPSEPPVTFKVHASGPKVCKVGPTTLNGAISEAEVTLEGPGKCQLEAEQPGNETKAGTQFEVLRDTQSIEFKSAPPQPGRVGGTYTVKALATSGQVVTFGSLTQTVCEAGSTTVNGEGVSEATVTLLTEGKCALVAKQAGDEKEWEPAESAPHEFEVSRNAQTVEFTSTPPASATAGGSYVVTAHASSGLSPTLASLTPAVCTLSGLGSGSTVSLVAAGTCTIVASQAGDGTYEAAPPAQQSFSVGATITITPPPSGKPPPPSSPPAATTAKSSFKAISATLHSPSFTITLKEQVSDAGTMSWLLTFPNGDFGVFGSVAKSRGKGKCKAGFMRLSGKCRPKRVTYGRGSMSFAAAGAVTITVKPSAAAKQALKTALRKKKNMRITAVLTFKPRNGATAVTHTQLLTVKLSSAK